MTVLNHFLKLSVYFQCKSDSRPFTVMLFTKHLFLKNNTQMFLFMGLPCVKMQCTWKVI